MLGYQLILTQLKLRWSTYSRYKAQKCFFFLPLTTVNVKPIVLKRKLRCILCRTINCKWHGSNLLNILYIT